MVMFPGHTGIPGRVDPSMPACRSRDALDRVGDKWSTLVMALLGDGARRYSDLRRAIAGISQRMLTHTLRGLERDGLVARTVTTGSPPTVWYRLTDAGRALGDRLRALAEWADEYRDHVAASRARFDSAAHRNANSPPDG